jgi:hypothetical protein
MSGSEWSLGHRSPRAGGGCTNEAAPRSESVPAWSTLAPGSLRKPGLSSPREAMLDDVQFVPRSFDIVNLENGELGLPGYP